MEIFSEILVGVLAGLGGGHAIVSWFVGHK